MIEFPFKLIVRSEFLGRRIGIFSLDLVFLHYMVTVDNFLTFDRFLSGRVRTSTLGLTGAMTGYRTMNQALKMLKDIGSHV